MDYRTACDMILTIQRDLHFKVQSQAGLSVYTQEKEALSATYVLLEYLANCVAADGGIEI